MEIWNDIPWILYVVKHLLPEEQIMFDINMIIRNKWLIKKQQEGRQWWALLVWSSPVWPVQIMRRNCSFAQFVQTVLQSSFCLLLVTSLFISLQGQSSHLQPSLKTHPASVWWRLLVRVDRITAIIKHNECFNFLLSVFIFVPSHPYRCWAPRCPR